MNRRSCLTNGRRFADLVVGFAISLAHACDWVLDKAYDVSSYVDQRRGELVCLDSSISWCIPGASLSGNPFSSSFAVGIVVANACVGRLPSLWVTNLAKVFLRLARLAHVADHITSLNINSLTHACIFQALLCWFRLPVKRTNFHCAFKHFLPQSSPKRLFYDTRIIIAYQESIIASFEDIWQSKLSQNVDRRWTW